MSARERERERERVRIEDRCWVYICLDGSGLLNAKRCVCVIEREREKEIKARGVLRIED